MADADPVDWEAKYREGATPWERPGLHPAFLDWRARGVLRPGRVLVPGAGRSPEPLALAEAGFEVTVVDSAPSAIAAQTARLERVNLWAQVVKADFFTWEPGQPFDAIYDQTCLSALPPGLLPDYAARLRRWLRPGGKLFVLFVQTGQDGGPPFHCDLSRMHELFAPGEWEWPPVLPDPYPHPVGFTEQPVVLGRV
ncbi:MAG: methyltransferase domain-containing protein [Acetobacteraceae bacterium]|nr:methyltransferase domain-containing protein [Acetobacteraceae bacterium]MBV8592607.1 methyltransferase domain-containing protein [Acetobacteraceae bacterium]